MNKESVWGLMSAYNEDGQNWLICTDMPVGRGINGVSYRQFSNKDNPKMERYDPVRYGCSIVCNGNNYLTIVDKWDNYFYIPYEHICMISDMYY